VSAFRLSRHTGTLDVGRELTRNWAETDLRSVLPSVKVPTLLLVQDIDARDVEEAEYIASLMPQAEFKTFPAGEWTSPEVRLAAQDEFQRFVGVELPRPDLDTVLATIMFTDIVGSTEVQSALGDRA